MLVSLVEIYFNPLKYFDPLKYFLRTENCLLLCPHIHTHTNSCTNKEAILNVTQTFNHCSTFAHFER